MAVDFRKGYHAVSRDDPDKNNDFLWERFYVERHRSNIIRNTLVAALILSASMNLTLAYHYFQTSSTPVTCRSDFAQLEREIQLPFAIEGHENTTPDEEWLWPDADTGTVALADGYSDAKALPRAQRYPWDYSKGLYFIQGYHNLHCLYTVRDSIMQYRKGQLQTEHLLHVDHCLTALREDILCNADDTPRFTGGHFKQANSGTGQTRLCRDWSKLEKWATEHSACYRTPVDPWDGQSTLERYKSCPDNSTPWVGAEVWEGVEPPDY